MSEARIDRISNENSTAGPIISGITTFSGQNYFVPPKGTTAERPSNCPAGSIRFNTDSAKLEYFDSLQWLEMEAFNNELGISTAAVPASSGTGHRGLFAGGYVPSPASGSSEIDYFTISTLGNSIDFGTFTGRYGLGSCSSSTRALFAGGTLSPGNRTNSIQFVTISSTGNGETFGNLDAATRINIKGASSQTRGVFFGGFESPLVVNKIDYVTIASTGNAVDFGDLTVNVQAASATSSSTRAVRFGGGIPTRQDTIDYITISTTGNAQNFGTLSAIAWFTGSCSNSTRGLNAGNNPATNVIDFITISSTGNAQDFGDLNGIRQNFAGCSSPTRGIFGGGSSPQSNSMDFVTIPTTGNAQDFGDLTSTNFNDVAACSNGHGGL